MHRTQMDDDYWNPARLPFLPMSAGRPSSADLEQRERDSTISERVAIQRASEQSDPETAKRLLKRLARRVRDGIPLSDYAREFLGEALEYIADDPSCAAPRLGLVAPKGRPPIDHFKLAEAATLVAKLVSENVPLKDGRNGPGAYTQAAQATGISASTIAREWPHWKIFIQSIDTDGAA